jgi:hypothetical protein
VGNRRPADAAWELLAAGRIACEEIVQPVVRFEEAAGAYREFADVHPERRFALVAVSDDRGVTGEWRQAEPGRPGHRQRA